MSNDTTTTTPRNTKSVYLSFSIADAERFSAIIAKIRADNPGINKTGALRIICDRLEGKRKR